MGWEGGFVGGSVCWVDVRVSSCDSFSGCGIFLGGSGGLGYDYGIR